jgi:hypothetical protein
MFEHRIGKWVHILSIAIVLFGALNGLSIGFFRYDFITRPLGKRWARWIFGLIGIAAITIVFHRDTYLPFLGETVFPCSLLIDRSPPGAAKNITVTVEPGAKVLYWAAEPDTEHLEHLNDWRKAYLKFENAGITTANEEGVATLKVRNPQAYTVLSNIKYTPSPVGASSINDILDKGGRPTKLKFGVPNFSFYGTVMGGRRIGPHIHYRVCGDKWPGMMTRVQTVFLD